MLGLQHLISQRRRGLRPEVLLLRTPGMAGHPLAGCLDCGAERPETADLRALVELRVVVLGETGRFDEAERWARAACRAGAGDVGIAIGAPRESWIDGPVWIRVNGEQLA
ncbi:hypothetical protein [Roseateles puraquae]|uniref:hypothetical protein n=1 Tax=Roseateles puraquae TaxID=431059 RepID=UPI0031D6F18C